MSLNSIIGKGEHTTKNWH